MANTKQVANYRYASSFSPHTLPCLLRDTLMRDLTLTLLVTGTLTLALTLNLTSALTLTLILA